jgi:hypothetical protein
MDLTLTEIYQNILQKWKVFIKRRLNSFKELRAPAKSALNSLKLNNLTHSAEHG